MEKTGHGKCWCAVQVYTGYFWFCVMYFFLALVVTQLMMRFPPLGQPRSNWAAWAKVSLCLLTVTVYAGHILCKTSWPLNVHTIPVLVCRTAHKAHSSLNFRSISHLAIPETAHESHGSSGSIHLPETVRITCRIAPG